MATIATPAATKIAKMIARRAPSPPEKAIRSGAVTDLVRNFDAKRFIGFMPVLSRRDLSPMLLKSNVVVTL